MTAVQRDWISESAPTSGLLISTPRLTREYLATNKLSANFPRRFHAKVQKTQGGCWRWQAAKINSAYGQCARGKPFAGMVSAHVASWILHRGPVPAGLCVLHNCPGGDCPGCVNPAHLWLGSHAQNMADKVAKGRTTAGWRGESHKLKPEDKGHIVDLRRAGVMSLAETADAYSITTERVKQICREAWRVGT